jgi:hypothetical protein
MSPAKLKTITWGLIISVIFLLIFWDIFDKIADPTGNSTISWQIWLAACSRPIIGVGVGILIGHLFWQTPPLKFIKTWRDKMTYHSIN